MNKKYIVTLTDEERKDLKEIVNKGKTQAYRIKHANILLSADIKENQSLSDKEIAEILCCHTNTVFNVRRRFVEQGLDAALNRKRQKEPSRKRILDGEKEAKLIQIACSEPPSGRAKWTLKLLSERLIALDIVPSISEQTVRRALKKMNYARICENAG